MDISVIKEYWSIVLGFLGLVVWVVRLEAGMKSNAKDIRSLWRQRAEDQEVTRASRSETNALLHKLDTKLDAAFHEVRADIKTLLRRDNIK
jgi:hypothetical protein